MTVTDLMTGVTSLVDQQSHYESLDGIVWTPWHTLLFAEEKIVASFDDPRVPNAVGGLVYEYDPRTGVTTPRPAVGVRSHEGLRFDAQGNLYGISESTPGQNGSGAIYKFVPDRRGDLSSGQLYVLKVAELATELRGVPLTARVPVTRAAAIASARPLFRPEYSRSLRQLQHEGRHIMDVTAVRACTRIA